MNKSAHNNWSKKVKRKANYTCEFCSSKIVVQAHHLQDKQNHPDLAYEVTNGICLCVVCHKSFHYWHRRLYGINSACTAEHLYEWQSKPSIEYINFDAHTYINYEEAVLGLVQLPDFPIKYAYGVRLAKTKNELLSILERIDTFYSHTTT